MKNAYLFSIEIDALDQIVSSEIGLLTSKYPAEPLIEVMKKIKTNLGLLALCITGDLDANEENKLINQLLVDFRLVASSHLANTATINNSKIKYSEIINNLKTVINIYQSEKQKELLSENFNDVLSEINEKTRVIEMISSKRQDKTQFDLFQKQKKTIITFEQDEGNIS